MPWSATCFDALVEQTIARLRPASMLDIGAGAGKYGSMTRRASPETWTVAVEAQAEYVEAGQVLQGRAPEAHVSVWGPQDFSWFQTQHHRQGKMNLAVVTGFLADPDATIVAEGAQPLGPPRAEAPRP